jgi:Ni,Fe-hydrogenase I small subunit
LVLEQNHFEFEPSLQKIKGKKSDEIKGDRSDKYKGQKISLYDGTILGKNGEIDIVLLFLLVGRLVVKIKHT